MPSGKKSKQARRIAATAPPPVRSKGAPRGRRQASPRMLAGVAALVVVIGVGVALAVAFGGGGGKSAGTLPTTVRSTANGLPGSADVEAMLKGIPQKGMTLGSDLAPVTMVEYVDLQCPYCQQFETQVLPDLLRRYVRPGKVKIEARPLAFIGPDSIRGRDAMVAASLQNKAFNFAEILYENQQTENTGWLNDQMVLQAAESVPGLNPAKLNADRSLSSVKKQASSYDRLGNADKVTGTPTLFVGKSGTHGKQVPLSSPTDEQAVVTAIANAGG